mmetsp:Transcript_24745/g.36295  ORF Transcript_24745/g.36295 Transcript_24745/m.36295 type:complete len:171 (+) Transcript_24745:72-584(+)
MEHCNEEYKTRRTRVLLGITGSVAAVKGPEIAVRLSKEVGADVRVLLTRAGENFWNKAKEYDPVSWQQFTKIRDDTVKATQSDGFSRNDDCSDHAQNSEKEKGKKKVCDIVDNDKNCLGDGEIIVHSKYACFGFPIWQFDVVFMQVLKLCYAPNDWSAHAFDELKLICEK